MLPTPIFLGFPGGSAGKESACNAGELGLIPGLGRSPGGWDSYPLKKKKKDSSMDVLHRESLRGSMGSGHPAFRLLCSPKKV